MEITSILVPIVSFGIVGLAIGGGLGFAGKKLKVEEDERLPLIIDELPSANCGGCGYAGCAAFANALIEGKAPVTGCPVGDSTMAEKIADILGVSVGETSQQVAFVKCIGGCSVAKNIYDYSGIEDCTAMSYLPASGSKSCSYGCLGGGSCVRACPFDAITMEDGIAVILKDKCVACGACVDVCPKSLIELIPFSSEVTVGCSSHDKGPVVKSHCGVGCIGCRLCVKSCEFDAISVNDMLAKVDYAKCTNCNACVQKCPANTIRSESYSKVPA